MPTQPFSPLFRLGLVYATPCALRRLSSNQIYPRELLRRHLIGDWGDLDAVDRDANARALIDHTRLMSVYRMPDNTKVYLITEADRSCTTFLCPIDY